MLALALTLLLSQPHGELTASPTSVEGAARKSTAVDKFIDARKAGLLNCYEQSLAANPNLKGGKVTLQFLVLVTGRTAEVDLQSTFDRDLGACITRLMGSWVFPEADEGVRVSLELKLKKGT